MMTDQQRQRREYEEWVKLVAKGHDFRACGNGEFFDGEPHDAEDCARMTKRMEGMYR